MAPSAAAGNEDSGRRNPLPIEELQLLTIPAAAHVLGCSRGENLSDARARRAWKREDRAASQDPDQRDQADHRHPAPPTAPSITADRTRLMERPARGFRPRVEG